MYLRSLPEVALAYLTLGVKYKQEIVWTDSRCSHCTVYVCKMDPEGKPSLLSGISTGWMYNNGSKYCTERTWMVCHEVESGYSREPNATVHQSRKRQRAEPTNRKTSPEEALKRSLSALTKTAVSFESSTKQHLQGSKSTQVVNYNIH